MKKTCIFLILIICSLPFVGWAQSLQVSELNGRARQVSIVSGSSVKIRFLNHTKKKDRMKTVEGRIIHINDSSLTIKKAFVRKEITINISDIRKLQKQTIGRYMVFASLPVALCVLSITSYSIFPPLIALSILPSAALANVLFLKHTVKHPLTFQLHTK